MATRRFDMLVILLCKYDKAETCEAGARLAYTPPYLILATPRSVIMPIFAD